MFAEDAPDIEQANPVTRTFFGIISTRDAKLIVIFPEEWQNLCPIYNQYIQNHPSASVTN